MTPTSRTFTWLRQFAKLWGFALFCVFVVYIFREVVLPFLFAILVAYILAPLVDRLVPGTGHQAMLVVGVVEILAGVLVAVRPHLGAYVVAAWLAGIIVNLLLIPGFYDVALRDFGLLLAALALARLARAFRPEAPGGAKASAS